MQTRIKYPLLSIDLDGTLLNKFKRISKHDLKALIAYNKQAGIIFINTGKNLEPTKKIIEKLNKNLKYPIRYFSCLNGNIIYDLKYNKIIKQSTIDDHVSIEIIKQIKQANLWFIFYQQNKDKIIKFFNKIGKNFNSIFKINIVAKFKSLSSYNSLIKNLEKYEQIELLKTNKRLYEIVKKNHNKGQALMYICKLLNIELKNVASIGDSFNDLAMFKLNNNGFLVKKSVNEILNKSAHYRLNLKKNKVSYIIKNYVCVDELED